MQIKWPVSTVVLLNNGNLHMIIKIVALFIFSSTVIANNMTELNALTEQIKQEEFKQMTSVLVNHKGQLVYEQYFNQGGQDVKNDMRSASKSITSLAIGLAIQDQLLAGVKQKVLPFFDDKLPIKNPDPRKAEIDIEDLLTMSNVLECDDWNSASRGNEERMYIIEDWTKFILDLPIRGTAPWRKTPEKSKYGRSAYYCTGGVQVLADIVERVSKQKMSEYLQTKLFKPLGIQAPEFSYTPLGVTGGGGGMRMTSRDWLEIGQLMMNQGTHNKQNIINAEWVDASFTRRAVIDEGRKTEYGYLWWIFDFKTADQTITAYAAAGNGGNYMFMIPALEAQVVITSTAYNTNYMHQQSQKILTDYVIPALLKHAD